jgi:hypothetical protein
MKSQTVAKGRGRDQKPRVGLKAGQGETGNRGQVGHQKGGEQKIFLHTSMSSENFSPDNKYLGSTQVVERTHWQIRMMSEKLSIS